MDGALPNDHEKAPASALLDSRCMAAARDILRRDGRALLAVDVAAQPLLPCPVTCQGHPDTRLATFQPQLAVTTREESIGTIKPHQVPPVSFSVALAMTMRSVPELTSATRPGTPHAKRARTTAFFVEAPVFGMFAPH